MRSSVKALPEALAARLRARGILRDDGDDGDASTSSKRAKGDDGRGATVARDGREEKKEASVAPLPSGWKQKMDEKYGKVYYYNKTLKKTQWERPVEEDTVEELVAKPAPPPPPPVKRERAGPLPPGWSVTVDPRSGKEYYFNVHTQETSWERPKDAATAVGMRRCGNCGGFGRGLVKQHGYCLNCSRMLGKPPPGMKTLEVVENRFMTKNQRERAEMQAKAAAPEEKKNPVVVVKAARAQTNDIGPSMGVITAKKAAAVPASEPKNSREPLDPMDPSSYSDAPRGGWGSGIERSRAE